MILEDHLIDLRQVRKFVVVKRYYRPTDETLGNIYAEMTDGRSLRVSSTDDYYGMQNRCDQLNLKLQQIQTAEPGDRQ